MNKPLLLIRLDAPTPYLSVGSLTGNNYILKKCTQGRTSVQRIGHFHSVSPAGDTEWKPWFPLFLMMPCIVWRYGTVAVNLKHQERPFG